MALRLPITTGLYSMYSAYTHTKHSGQFGSTMTGTKQGTYKNYMALVKYSAAIFTTFIGFMFNCVVYIFVGRPIAQVRYGVIVSIPVYVTDHHTGRATTNKRFGYHGMDTLGCLGPILRSFPKGYRQVVSSSVRLPNKSLVVFDSGDSTKTANLVSIMTRYGSPKLGGIYHG